MARRFHNRCVIVVDDTVVSMQLFFMANYDMDRFRHFIESTSFSKTYVIADEEMEKLKTDDYALMKFGFRLLKQVLFGDKSITERDVAYEQRIEERGDIIQMCQKAEREAMLENAPPRYKPEDDVKEEDLQ